MKYYAYEDFKQDTNTIIKRVESFKADAIVGVARGGLTLAHALAEGLKIREVQAIRTELYDDMSKREQLSVFDTLSFTDASRVLIVDDIADSGETLLAVMEHLKVKYPHILFHSATLFYKKSSLYEPHTWINEADDWIDFFWERDFKQ